MPRQPLAAPLSAALHLHRVFSLYELHGSSTNQIEYQPLRYVSVIMSKLRVPGHGRMMAPPY